MGSMFSYCVNYLDEEQESRMSYTDLLAERPSDKFTVEIDFDEASNSWRENKFNIACCKYVYICPFITNNKKCGSRPFNGRQYCIIHNHLNPSLTKLNI